MSVRINGRRYEAAVEPHRLLSDLLREACGLTGTQGEAEIREAAALAAADINPESDLHASADFRHHLAGLLTARGLRRALTPGCPVRDPLRSAQAPARG